MSGAGRRRRGTSSIAPSPSPTSSSSSSGRPEPRPSQLPQWKFSQVLGDLPHAAAGGRRDGTYQCKSQSVSNECSALELTEASSCACGSGRNLGHRVRRPRRVPGRRRPRRARDPLPEGRRRRGTAPRRAGAHGPRRRAAAEVQLRDGVPEPRVGVRRAAQPGDRREDQEGEVVRAAEPLPVHARHERSHRQALEGQVSEHKAPKEGDGEPRRRASTAASLPLQEPRSERATTKPRGSSADSADQIEKVGDVGDGYSAKCRRVFDRAHEFNVNSISNNCDGETFVSADDLRINLWHLEVTSQCFNIVDLKPADMGDLVEVIATAEFHPSSCSLLAYGSSGGLVRLVDLRRSALCDQSARTFRDRGSRPQPSTFFTEIISCITDLKFTGEGRYLLTRDYMNLKLWDMSVETSPVATYKVHEFLRPKLSELYAEDYIFDRFSCCASKDGSYFATGSYSNTFKVFTRTASQTTGTTLEASANPYRVQSHTSAKIPALLSNFSLGVSRKGQDGPRSDGKEEIPCNMASRVTHLAWHPTENFIVCAANNSLYMYHT
ncbi:serine/threonine protein phosphatase 2A 55 kDa regulatory subunit B beta isoform-like isoform X2 [Panicum virgatum]|uniref:serine/threonine protein phosphatase 2A 55 kDa regulatory subunit B beta isoform-like isoform X2 n=1 Tax=Panicum virgatum TaxID=38727 RepID=UPI0019D59FFE|nr:serine/threonine protein phosphatase 2A 55 kDa regulatory subunit B beta isoform-like isoform X2 [Panicum virgatum]